MLRSAQRRTFRVARQRDTGDRRLSRRLVVALAAIAVIGGMAAVAQISSAATNRFPAAQTGNTACGPTSSSGSNGQQRRGRNGRRQLPRTASNPELDTVTSSTGPGASAGTGAGASAPAAGSSGASAPAGRNGSGAAADPCPSGSGAGAGAGSGAGSGGSLDTLGDSCENSRLPAHNGFQTGGKCVGTAFGEVGTAAQNPSLLITQSPQRVRVNQPFTLQVSTRNLVRDRFLAAAAGGYYVESSFLNAQGLQRGHFHTACRMLQSTRVAPDPAPVPAFFKATEDGNGGAQPDQVTVEVTGMPSAGTAQCAVWAGDGSHRTPMMERANQTPAFDVVRITVTP